MNCICSSRDLFNFGCRCRRRLRVFHNGVDWVIAHNPDEARQILMDLVGYSEQEADGDGWIALADDEELSINDEDGTKTCLTAQGWIDEIGKPEFICSREF